MFLKIKQKNIFLFSKGKTTQWPKEKEQKKYDFNINGSCT
jgi:hypothetical protein